jgi:hypothetical protein
VDSIRKHRTMTGIHLPSVLLVSLAGYHHWVPLAEPLDRAIELERPGTIRVWTADTSQILTSPVIRGDTLIGIPDDANGTGGAVILPLSNVQRIEARKTQVSRAVLLAWGGMMVLWIGMCAAFEVCGGVAD